MNTAPKIIDSGEYGLTLLLADLEVGEFNSEIIPLLARSKGGK